MNQAGVEQLVPGQEKHENFTSPGDHTLLLLLDVIPKNKANNTLTAHEMCSLNEKCKITWVIFSWIKTPLEDKYINLKITTKQKKHLLSILVLWGTFFRLLLKENQPTTNHSRSAFLVLFPSAFVIQATPLLRSSAKKVSQKFLF